jgi:hypothetical protein
VYIDVLVLFSQTIDKRVKKDQAGRLTTLSVSEAMIDIDDGYKQRSSE